MGNYKKLDSADITYIKEIVKDEERVLTGDFINEEYSHDELGGTSSYPDVVVRAKSTETDIELLPGISKVFVSCKYFEDNFEVSRE